MLGFRKTVDENNDEALAYFYLEQMEQQINEKAMSFTGDEQSFPYMLRLRESANLLKVSSASCHHRSLCQ